jgi:hypothetical protein
VIARALDLNHATVMYHARKVKELCDFDRSFRKLFIDTEDYVLIHLAGRFKEDGSGEKEKEDENDQIPGYGT